MLLVDDNDAARASTEALLRSWGVVVAATSSARRARAAVVSGVPFNAAIVDHMMPERDGAALCRELRQLRPGLPRILMTTDRWFDAGSLTELALTATLNKPAKRPALQQALLAANLRGPAAGRRTSPSGQFWALAEQRPLRILVAEDNAFNQVVIVRMLAKLGYSADVADNGSAAVEAVMRRPYDLVLMDMHMPVMDGLEASVAIARHFGAGGRPHIIALTAAALAEERQRCIDAGMDDYVSKPIVVEKLIEALERIPRRGS